MARQNKETRTPDSAPAYEEGTAAYMHERQVSQMPYAFGGGRWTDPNPNGGLTGARGTNILTNGVSWDDNCRDVWDNDAVRSYINGQEDC